MTSNNLKLIAVSRKNYLSLKRLGNAGDSFNDVVTQLLEEKSSSHKTKDNEAPASNAGGGVQ
jgi:predicted CopG family antitoxin